MADLSLAIDCTGPVGAIALGAGDRVRHLVELPRTRRHTIELLPALDDLLTEHGHTKHEVGICHVCVGPGSFTGIRVAISTAATLARILGWRLTAVPVLDALAERVPVDSPSPLTVAVSPKQGTVYAGRFAASANHWQPIDTPSVRELARLGNGPIVGHTEASTTAKPSANWQEAPPSPGAAAVYAVGHRLAQAGQFTDPLKLTPCYGRPPEAVTLWQARHGA